MFALLQVGLGKTLMVKPTNNNSPTPALKAAGVEAIMAATVTKGARVMKGLALGLGGYSQDPARCGQRQESSQTPGECGSTQGHCSQGAALQRGHEGYGSGGGEGYGSGGGEGYGLFRCNSLRQVEASP